MNKKLKKLHTGRYGLVDSNRWKYLRLFETHETASGATRINEVRIAKIPWDFMDRLTLSHPIFVTLYELYRKRRWRTVGIREAKKIITVAQVTKALTK